jgi:hypothetical protein
MITREEMIKALIKNELDWLIQNPKFINDLSEFFTRGGFNHLSDEHLKKHYDSLYLEV